MPTRKALAMLVYLVLEPRLHPRERLASLFWPESDSTHARAALRFTLAALRTALGETEAHAHLRITRDSVSWGPSSDVELDLVALESASDISAWRGEFLEGFSLPDAPDFDEWLSLQRERWQALAEAAFERAAVAAWEAGEAAEATQIAQRWVAMSPLNEAAYRQLMRGFAASGQSAAALRVFETCRTMLRRELGTLPAPETEALAERIRGTAAGEPPTTRPAALSAAAAEAPLVGRAAEQLRLIEVFHAARQARSHVAVVVGEAGIGKTRLATELLGWAAAQSADVLRGRAFEAGGRLPYQPVVDALRPRVERENAPDDLLADVWLAELSRLLPELRERYPDLPPLDSDETTARTRLYEAVARLVQAFAERQPPLVLFVDDVQWLDSASLHLLHYATRRWSETATPAMVLLTLRSEALADTPTVAEWLAGLRKDPGLIEIPLGPLTLEDTRALLQRLDPVDDFVRWLFNETGGQPFFLTEMLRALQERGVDLQSVREEPNELVGFIPPGVRDLVRNRLDHLAAETRALLSAAAVLGHEFSFDNLWQVADLSEDQGLAALDQALRAHLLRESSLTEPSVMYCFTHDKIRDAVHAESGEARRRVFHRRAIDALRTEAPAADLARHAYAAGLDEPAARFNLQAGAEAMRLLAAPDAIVHFERALQIAERRNWPATVVDARMRRAQAFASIGRWADAKHDLELVLDGSGPRDLERRADVLAKLAEACYWLMDVPNVRRHARDAAELALAAGRQDVLIAARGWLGGALGADGSVADAIQEFEAAVDLAHAAGAGLPASVLTFHSLSLYWLGRLDEAVDRSRASVEAARAANDASALMYTLPHLALSLASSGRYTEAMRVFDEARRFGRDYRIDNLLARAIAMSSGFRMDLGDFAGAEALAHEARDLALSAGWPPTVASASIDLLFNFLRRGEVGRAESLLAEVAERVHNAAGFHGWLWRLRLAQARAEIALQRREWQAAVDLATSAIDESRARGRRKYAAAGLHVRAQARLGLAELREAVADLQHGLAQANATGDPLLVLRIAHPLVELTDDGALAANVRVTVARVRLELQESELLRYFDSLPWT